MSAAKPNYRLRKAAEDGGGTAFADLVWRPVVLVEMKKRGTDLQKHFRQAFDYWSASPADAPLRRPLQLRRVLGLRLRLRPRRRQGQAAPHGTSRSAGGRSPSRPRLARAPSSFTTARPSPASPPTSWPALSRLLKARRRAPARQRFTSRCSCLFAEDIDLLPGISSRLLRNAPRPRHLRLSAACSRR